ncbi:F510_1955 family glycosylhydrolase [Knoellia sp. LjRoot47]|uniref:F510_1955 family glycosylhydrolase n=1 Tax=Knoellia sp. LjRoot47 TaxID=3342330 RepID=UPI003F4F44D6
MHHTARQSVRALFAVTVFVALLSACSANADNAKRQAPALSAAADSAPLPSVHVHGVGRDPGDGALLLATHEGLFRYAADGPVRVGPSIDLMGFSIAGPGHYYASGHPNMVPELPQPMGLIESTDGGKTWTVLSRGGQSDFHTLTQAGDTVLAFDGKLRRTTDGRQWSTAPLPAHPRTLAANPDGSKVLATTEGALLGSTDKGATWQPIPDAPLLLHVAWADAGVVAGVTPGGEVATSADGAQTWTMTGAKVPPPQAVSASQTAQGFEILVVTEREVLASQDGKSFSAIR